MKNLIALTLFTSALAIAMTAFSPAIAETATEVASPKCNVRTVTVITKRAVEVSGSINNQGDRVTIPANTSVRSTRDCGDFHVIEYNNREYTISTTDLQ